MITHGQVADLREGDVVEVYRPDWRRGTTMRGPLIKKSDGLYVGDLQIQWSGDGDKRIAWMLEPAADLTVISRAPRAYVNHSRPTFFRGDVVRVESAEPEDGYVDVYAPRTEHDPVPWVSLAPADFLERYSTEDAMPSASGSQRAVLLVDGETGQVVPS